MTTWHLLTTPWHLLTTTWHLLTTTWHLLMTKSLPGWSNSNNGQFWAKNHAFQNWTNLATFWSYGKPKAIRSELQKCLRKLNQPTEQRSVNPFCPENAQKFTQN